MRTDFPSEHVSIRTLAELDALVGNRVMSVSPVIYWEDSYANQRFDSLEEALEAMRDPYFQLFLPESERSSAVFSEVREYPPYSSNIALALEVVERISAGGDSLHLRNKNHCWIASFGSFAECRARTAAAAICVAAMRARGVCIEVREGVGAESWR